jgi:hypothetical protein
MNTSQQYDTLIAICIIKKLNGTANVQDMQILQKHAAALIGDDKIVKALYKIHKKVEA